MNNELEIKISSNVEKANEKLDNLIKLLNDSSVASDNYSKTLKRLETSLNEINGVLTKTNRLSNFVTVLNKAISTAEILSNISLSTFNKQLDMLLEKEHSIYSKFKEIDLSDKIKWGKGNEKLSFIEDINKATLSAKRLESIDLNLFQGQLSGLISTLKVASNYLKNIDGNGISKVLSSIPRSINSLNKIDMRKTYGTFSALTRIIEPFLNKLQQSEKALLGFVSISKSLVAGTNSINKISYAYENLNAKLDKSNKSTSLFMRLMNFGSLVYYARRFWQVFYDGIDTINQYTENLNLFHIVMGDLTDQADKFQNTMSEAFGNNVSTQLYYQSMYQSLTESMGLQEKYAYIISENMTKMVYDISSLFDQSQETVASALRAGLVGQTKPVRNYGLDITENSLQPILERLEIDKTVRELSQVEKQILRYIALLEQSSVAHGDMANTIESPANQLRVLKNQLVECARWLGAVFINKFAEIMPYINAFVMVVKEVTKAIAFMFGFEFNDYNSGLATYEDMFEDIESSVDDTTDSIKELKRQTLGFDQINNINENKDKGNDNISGGIDQRLLDAIKGYDNGMDKIRMKATEIRDRIMEWLGFMQVGEKWIHKGWEKPLKNLKKWFKQLNTEGKIFVGLGIALIINKIINSIKKLGVSIGTSGLLSKVKSLTSPIRALNSSVSASVTGFNTLGYSVKGVTKGVADGINTWSENLTLMDRLKVSLIGAGGLALSWSLASDSVKEFNETGEVNATVIGRMGLSLGSGVVSGALLGSQFGVLGTVIGGVSGAVISLTSYMLGLETEQDKLLNKIIESSEAIIEYSDNYKLINDEIDNNANKSLLAISQNEKYIAELEKLVNTNGKIKSGYETRVNYILNELSNAYGIEFKIVDGQILKYEELIETIEETIKKKKAEILLDAYKEKYANAIKEQATAWKNYQKAIENVNKAQEEYEKSIEDMYYNSSYSKHYQQKYKTLEEFRKAVENSKQIGDNKYKKALEDSKKALEKAEETWNTTTNNIINYEKLMSASISGDFESINNAINNFTQESSLSLSDQIKMYKSFGDNYKKITGEVNANTYSLLDTTIDTLLKNSQTVEQLTPTIVEAWGTLSNESSEKFKENIAKLPQNIQNVLLGKMALAGYNVGIDLKNGLVKSETEINNKSKDIGGNITKGVVNGAEGETNKGNIFTNFFNLIYTKIKNVFGITSNASTMKPLGAFITQGLVSGMEGANVPDLFKKFATGFINNIKNVLKIHSPSRLAIPIGIYTVMGIEEGMQDEIPNIKSTALDLVNTLQSTFDKGMYDLSLESAIMPNLTNDIANLSTYNTETNIDYNMLEQASYNGFSKAIKQYGLVRIDVKQDKGSIVETAIEGINNITKQTGENPIDLW